MWNMWLFYGWMKISLWLFPVTSAVAENVSTYGDRHMGRTDSGGSSGNLYWWSRSQNLADSLSRSLDLILCLFFFPSPHCRRGSWPPVCCLPDPSLSLSHEEKGRRQLRPWKETDLQESPYKRVLRLKLSSTLCPSRDKWTVWKHCALQWDVLNKRSFWIEFRSDFEGEKILYDPFHPTQLTRAQWNTKSLKKQNNKPQCTLSKASIKKKKKPNFLLVFIEGM